MSTATHPFDLESAVHRAAGGDAQAFADLVNASSNAVTSIALAICRDVAVSEDVAQEVYLVVWRRISELRNPASFLPWIRQITRYTARSWIRDRRSSELRQALPSRSDSPEDDLLSRAVDPRSSPESDLLDRERQAVLGETLADLPDETREVVILFYREGRSTQQVAGLLGLSEGAVRKRLQRAREDIRKDVLTRFGELAQKTAPGLAFSAAVTASLASAPAASAMGLAASATTQKVGLKSSALLGGAALGFLGGALGVVLGLRRDFRDAIDEQEVKQLRAVRNSALLALGLTCLGFMVRVAPDDQAVVSIGVFLALIACFGLIYLMWLPKILRRRFLVLEQGDEAAVQRRLKTRRRQALFGWALGSVSGGLGVLAGLWMNGFLG